MNCVKLSQLHTLIKQADHEVVEEWKWRGVLISFVSSAEVNIEALRAQNWNRTELYKGVYTLFHR